MDTNQIVTLLIAERDRLSKAIEALQGPAAPAAAKRRGRPPKNPAAATVAPVATPVAAEAPAAAKATKRKPRTAAQKRAQAERMRAYWAAKKKGK